MEFLFSVDALINLEQAEILHKHQGLNSSRKVSRLAYFKRLGWLGGLLPAYVGSSICMTNVTRQLTDRNLLKFVFQAVIIIK